jgi:hypothetical protein
MGGVAIFGSGSVSSYAEQWHIDTLDAEDLLRAFFSVYTNELKADLKSLRSYLRVFRELLGEDDESTRIIAALDPLSIHPK